MTTHRPTQNPPSAGADRLTARAKRNLTILFTVVAVLVLLLGAEAALRIRAIVKYGTSAQFEDYYTVDEKLGLRVAKPDFSRGPISTNRLGFRGPEIAMPKPADTIRLAFLGASTTWCAETSGNAHVWPHLVTAKLQRAFPNAHFDYVNAGLPGYTIQAITRNFEYRVAPLAPDVVVIYEAANNFSGEMRDLAVARGIIPEAKVHEFGRIGHYSLLWYLVEKNLVVLLAQRQAVAREGRLDVDTNAIGGEYRDLMRRLVHAAQQRTPLVAIATFSTQLRPGQTPEQQRRAAEAAFFFMPFVTPALVIDGIAQYNRMARDVAHETGALLIEGENDIPGDAQHFADTYHFTDAGSEAMAVRISDALIASPRFKALLSAHTASAAPR